MPDVRLVLNPCDASVQCAGKPIQIVVPLMGGEYFTRITPDEARQIALELLDMSRKVLGGGARG